MIHGVLTSVWWIGGTCLLALMLHILLSLVRMVLSLQEKQQTSKTFPGPSPHWLFGNIPQMKGAGQALARYVEWTGKYGDAFATWMSFSYNVLRLTGPETVQAIMSTSEPKDPNGYKFIVPWIGDGLLVSKGKKWSRNRRLLTNAFHFDILRPYVKTFSESTSIMLDKWEKEAKVSGTTSQEMTRNISLMTLDSLMKCIFGVHDQNIQTQGDKHPYIQSVYRISQITAERVKFPLYHNDWVYALSPAGYQFRKHVAIAHKFTRDVIELKTKEQSFTNKAGKQKFSFLEMLLDCKDADGQGLSHQEICDEVDTFMFEGHDTTASGISFLLYNLAQNPDLQQKCREEMFSILGDKEHVEWDDIAKFEYLTQCVKESLRMYPPVPSIFRKTTKDITLPDGRQILEGTEIGISIYALHRNDRVWPNPEVFDPERFNAENSENRHSHAFVPFSSGPRNCIGRHFAYNEIKVCLAQLLRRFSVSVDESKPKPLVVNEMVLRPLEGIWLKCTPLKKT